MVFMPVFINFLQKHALGKQIRDMGPDGKATPLFSQLHKKKSGTPTMGGVVIWGTVLVMALLSLLVEHLGFIDHSLINRQETYLPLFALVSAGLLGMFDDWSNIKYKEGKSKHKGIRVKPKLFWLTAMALAGAYWFYVRLGYDSIHIPGLQYLFPIFETSDFLIGWWYIPLFIFIFIATTNAVNITDGLDGLAAGLMIFTLGGFAMIAFFKGLFLLATLLAAVGGALLAFLWWNVYPAKVFMGDTGSLALGAFLGVVAMLLDSVLVLPIIGFVFVIETLSVILQLLSKRFRGKKIWLIAPVHHHFEKIGWHEANVVMRFWIIGGVFAVIGTLIGVVGMGA